MPKLLPSYPPFEDYKVYGPYLATKARSPRNVRRMVALKRNDGYKTTMQYARYLLCVKEGRWLTAEEQADHIDDDRLNDDIGNLQILTPEANNEKSKRERAMVTLICPGCDEEFTRERNQTHLVKGYKNPTACSKSCAVKAHHRRKRGGVA